ncbi:MAG: hypothetical protein QNJ00_12790 [Woeseiaceae bacterium]|nr:hypothetical protein [Woeseiaceae bacterium]
MLGSTADKPIDVGDKQKVADRAGGLATRRIWLPKFLYDALPYFYMTAGFTAFFATLYISEWFWVLPHYLLFSAACVHLAVVIFRRRDVSADNPDIDE